MSMDYQTAKDAGRKLYPHSIGEARAYMFGLLAGEAGDTEATFAIDRATYYMDEAYRLGYAQGARQRQAVTSDTVAASAAAIGRMERVAGLG